MGKLKITLPGADVPTTGKQVSFIAPCDCIDISCLCIDGEDYTIVDSCCCDIAGTTGLWVSGAIVSVMLDVDNKRAFLLGAGAGASSDVLIWQNPDLYTEYAAADINAAGLNDAESYPYVIVDALGSPSIRLRNEVGYSAYLTNMHYDPTTKNVVLYSRKLTVLDTFSDSSPLQYGGVISIGDNYVTTITSSGISSGVDNSVNKPVTIYVGGGKSTSAGILKAIAEGSY